MRIYLPIVLIWHDQTIDCNGSSEVWAPLIYVRKGRTLTFRDIGIKEKIFSIKVRLIFAHGNIRMEKKPVEMTRSQLARLATEHEISESNTVKNEKDNY